MEIIELQNLLKEKEYPQGFIDDIVLFYPMMIKLYGENEVDNILKEWKYVIVDKLMGSSGYTDRDKKQIVVNNFNSHFYSHHLITALFHELRHALINPDYSSYGLLSQGHERENFFEKIEEGFVSDCQDDILNGQLGYNYIDGYSFKCRGDIDHADSYAFEKLYYNILKLLLGDKKELITIFFNEKDNEKRKMIYHEIIDELKKKLNEQELNVLLDSCAILILNHGYGERKTQTSAQDKINGYIREWYQYNLQFNKSEEERKELIEYTNKEFVPMFYEKNYKKIIEYAKGRKIIGTDIFTQSDRLCTMVVDNLLRRIEQTESFDFSLIKSICEYLVKINNRNVNEDKINSLINYLFVELNKLGINFDNEINEMFTQNELLGIITKIIAINGIDISKINEISIIKILDKDTLYLKCADSFIKISRKTTNDKIRTFDSILGQVDVNTVLPHVRLNYENNCTIGDENVIQVHAIENRFFCQIDAEKSKTI